MIKAIILDVDGVIIGDKIGVNSPDPHPNVLQALKDIRLKGIPICLCSAKPHYSLRNIIEDAQLDNFHITDGGAVIIDPIDDIVVQKHTIGRDLAVEVIKTCLGNSLYVEFYTVEDYFIQQSQYSEITQSHTHVLQKEPTVVPSLAQAAHAHEITKIVPIAEDEQNKTRAVQLLRQFDNRLMISWTIHPVVLPLQFGIVTAQGVSKKHAAVEVVKNLGISFDHVLGVGDSTSDWQFIELCKYAAAMGNASGELKSLVHTKGSMYSFIGPSVDENGVLKIFEHFLS